MKTGDSSNYLRGYYNNSCPEINYADFHINNYLLNKNFNITPIYAQALL